MLVIATFFILYSNDKVFEHNAITPTKIFYITWAIYAEASLYSGNPIHILLQILYLSGFTIGLFKTKLILQHEPRATIYRIGSRTRRYYGKIGVFLFLIGLSILSYKITSFGIAKFIIASRLDVAMVTRTDFVFSIADLVMSTGYLLSMSITIIEKNKMSKFQIIMAIIITSYSIITISKAQLMFAIIPIAYLMSERGKLRKLHIGIGIILGMFVLTIWKPVLGFIFYENRKLDSSSIKIPGELTNWIEMYDNIKDEPIKLGESLFKTLAGLSSPFSNYEPLSVWYAKRFIPEIWGSGGGRGFPTILEGYINFGVLGALIIGFIIGVYFGVIECFKRSSLPVLMISVVTMCIIHKFFRSELYSIFKTSIWLMIMPGIFSYYISRMRLKT